MKTTIDIAALMDEHNISQRKMAEILNVSQSYVSEIKNGKKPLSLKHEELLILQFGKEICDNFRIAKVDARRTQNFKGPVSGSKMPMGDLYEQPITSPKGEDNDVEVKLQIAEARIKSLEEQVEQLKSQLADKDSIIQTKQEMIDLLKSIKK